MNTNGTPDIPSTELVTDDPPSPGKFFPYRGRFLLVLFVFVLWLNITFLVPVAMGAIFTICLYPIMTKLNRWKLGATAKASIVTSLFAVSFLLPLGLMLYYSAAAALEKIQQLQQNGLNANQINADSLISFLRLRPVLTFVESSTGLSEGQINKGLLNVLLTAGTWGAQVLQNTLANVPGALFGAFIIVLTIFFLLIDGKAAVEFLKKNSIFGPKETDQIFRSFHSLCNSTVVASIAAGAVQALLILISCLLTGTPNAILITLIAFILSFLPMLGTAPVTLFLTAQAFINGNPGHGILFATNIVLVGLSDNIVRPYVLKGGASLHPLVGFVAAFGALDVLGFYGVFLGPVAAGLFFELLPIVARTYTRIGDTTAKIQIGR